METTPNAPTASLTRERLAKWSVLLGRLAFAVVLFSSPWMLQLIDIQRRLNDVYSGYTDFFVYPGDLFIVLTIVFGFAAPLLGGLRWKRGPWYLTFPLAALVALSFVGVLTGIDPALTLYHSVRFLLLFALYLAVINLTPTPEWVAAPLALAVVIQSTVAILQFLKQSSLGLQAWGELVLDPTDVGTSILRVGDLRYLRAYGLTDHPNLLGGFLCFALIFILGYYFQSARRVRYLFLLPFGLGITALFYTFSRAAELALMLGVALMVWAWLRPTATRARRWRDLMIAAAVAAVAVLVPLASNQTLLLQRLGEGNAFTENVSEARSLDERDALIESANRVFYQRQAFGVGNGALALGMFLLDKDFPKGTYYYQPAHFVLLDVTAELGILGGLVWLWLMLAPLVAAWVRRAQLYANPWFAAITAAVVVTLVVGFFDYYTWFWQSGRLWQWSAWALFGAAAVARQTASAVKQQN